MQKGLDTRSAPEFDNAVADETQDKSSRVKITVVTNAVPGWNEIDAVQLVGKK